MRFPRSLRFDQRAWRPTLPLRPRHGYAVDLHRDLPGQTCETLPGVSPTRTWTEVRTAHQPTSTGLELARFQEALQHRFLTYTVPSCSPSPAPPAVLNRLDFVAAAPALPDVPRVRLPPASPTCHDRPAAESSHLRSKPQRFVAHHREADTSASLWSRRLLWSSPPSARRACPKPKQHAPTACPRPGSAASRPGIGWRARLPSNPAHDNPRPPHPGRCPSMCAT